MREGPHFTLGQLAEALGGVVEGDHERVVSGVATLESAGPHQISFCTDPRYQGAARASGAGAFLAPPEITDLPGPVVRTANAPLAFVRLLQLFYPEAPTPPGVHPTAVVAAAASVDPTAAVGALAVIESGAVVGRGVRVGPLVYLGRGARIGDESVLHPHVVVREGVVIGRRVIVHAGAVLGADGFGYTPDGSAHRRIPQVGRVVIEDDVDIGANTTIDRATLGDTIVRRGTKIDNLVQIGHNVEVGEDCIIVAQVGLAGSVQIGRRVVLAGQVGVADHVRIADGVTVGAQSGIPSDISDPGVYLGYPARPALASKRIIVAESQLPDLIRRVRKLEQRLERLDSGPALESMARPVEGQSVPGTAEGKPADVAPAARRRTRQA
jgi:UDP-3-O-[3-hydroxymyristoyl] glucosamine N-acyltransferase